MITIFLATVLNFYIEDTQQGMFYKVYVNDKHVHTADEKEFQLDVDLTKITAIEVTANTKTHESDRLSVLVGKPKSPVDLQVVK